jgi:hypothetical protein
VLNSGTTVRAPASAAPAAWRRAVVFALRLFIALRCTSAASALAQDEPPRPPPMPEPLFNETMTDVDSDEPGEIEFELNAFRWQALQGDAYAMEGSLEFEWLITRHLGVFIEPFFTQTLDAGGNDIDRALAVSAGTSWKLVHDTAHDFYMQAELGGRYPLDATQSTDPGESALPFVLDLRAGLRRGLLSLRGSAGAEAGGTFAHVPLRASLGAFLPMGAGGRIGHFGLEADADGARRYPAVLALNVIFSLIPLGLPLKLGFGVPWAIGVPATQPVLGLLLRVFVESEREVAYGEQPAR